MPEQERERAQGRRLGFFQLVVPSLESERLRLDATARRHLRQSIRARPGDRLPATDGRGGRGELEILAWAESGVEVRTRLLAREDPPSRRLWLATRAADSRFDWLVEKAVELGAWGLLPLAAPAAKGAGRQDRRRRWQRLATAAVEQCGRAWLPVLEAPRPLAEILSAEPPTFTSVTLADPEGGAAAEALGVRLPGDHLLLVGPPEGLSAAEHRALEGAPHFGRVGLGPLRLRSETAALALLAALGPLWPLETAAQHP